MDQSVGGTVVSLCSSIILSPKTAQRFSCEHIENVIVIPGRSRPAESGQNLELPMTDQSIGIIYATLVRASFESCFVFFIKINPLQQQRSPCCYRMHDAKGGC